MFRIPSNRQKIKTNRAAATIRAGYFFGTSGKWIMVIGIVVLFAGAVVYFFHDKLNWIGRLPGDIRIERENFRLYIPITTMIIVSILFTIIPMLVRWMLK